MKKQCILSLWLLGAVFVFSGEQNLATVSVDTWGFVENGKVVYFDYHYLTSTLFWGEVVMVDITSKAKTVLAPTDGSYPYYISYGYSANRLTFIPYLGSGSGGGGGGGYGGGSTTLQYKNASTGEARALSSNTAWKEMVSMGGTLAVWVDYRYRVVLTLDSVNSEIFAYDFSTNQEKRITSDHAYQSYPVTDGARIAWIDYSGSYGKLMLHTLSTGETREIAPYEAGKNNPRLWGNNLVWEDYRNLGADPKNVDLFLYDIASDAVKPLCTAAGFQGRLYVSGTHVVWEDYRNAPPSDSLNSDIYAYDISNGREIAVVVKPGYQAHPTLSGDTLCWFSRETNLMQLTMLKLSELAAIENNFDRALNPLSIRLSKRGTVTVHGVLSGEPVQVRVYDLTGRCMARSQPSSGNSTGSMTVTLDNRLNRGVYALSIRVNDRTYRQKAVAW